MQSTRGCRGRRRRWASRRRRSAPGPPPDRSGLRRSRTAARGCSTRLVQPDAAPAPARSGRAHRRGGRRLEHNPERDARRGIVGMRRRRLEGVLARSTSPRARVQVGEHRVRVEAGGRCLDRGRQIALRRRAVVRRDRRARREQQRVGVRRGDRQRARRQLARLTMPPPATRSIPSRISRFRRPRVFAGEPRKLGARGAGLAVGDQRAGQRQAGGERRPGGGGRIDRFPWTPGGQRRARELQLRPAYRAGSAATHRGTSARPRRRCRVRARCCRPRNTRSPHVGSMSIAPCAEVSASSAFPSRAASER